VRKPTIQVAFGRVVPYTGPELRPHFLRHTFGIHGDAVVAWHGPCEVRGDALVDLEDRDAGDFIKSADMLHILVEQFVPNLSRSVVLQRLLASLAADLVRERCPSRAVVRRGDDVYVDGGKLSVSIATVSPVSSLIHFGMNIDGRGAPVAVSELNALGIDPRDFAEVLLDRFASEIDGIIDATCKVVPAHPG